MRGKVIIAGAGFGDYELITLKLKKVLEEADCIIYDRLIDKRMLSYAKRDCELIYLGKENTAGGKLQNIINETLVEKAKVYRKVVRLKGGHPFVFGRGGEEIEFLLEHGIGDFEVIPGLTSAISAPAYAGIPVTHRGTSASFHVFTGHRANEKLDLDFDTIAKLEGTLIFLMGVKSFGENSIKLIEAGKEPETPVAFIHYGGREEQKVWTTTLAEAKIFMEENKVKSPSVVVVGQVAEFHNRFDWYRRKKSVLVTRDAKKARVMADQLADASFASIELPLIDIVPSGEVIGELSAYEAILFNSANGVESFMEKLDDIRQLANVKIGAVGVKTVEKLSEYKLIADIVPDEYRIDKLMQASLEITSNEARVLVVTSQLSPFNPDSVSGKGKRTFEKFIAYETKKHIYTREVLAAKVEGVDYITFLSSSTVEAFVESGGKELDLIGKSLVSIGPQTTSTLKSYGFENILEAKKYTAKGIIELLEEVEDDKNKKA